jgi:hypothetical protein
LSSETKVWPPGVAWTAFSVTISVAVISFRKLGPSQFMGKCVI